MNVPILITALTLTYSCAQVHAQTLTNFKHFGTHEGLPHIYINGIAQDSLGFLWISAWNGISRYDGSTFKTYAPNSKGSENKNPRYSQNLIRDNQGNIWGIEGPDRIYNYVPQQDQFIFYGMASIAKDALPIAIYPDRKNNLWIGTQAYGLFRFDRIRKEFLSFNAEFHQDLPTGSVTNIIEDRFGNLWFSYPNGIYRFSWKDSTLVYFPLRPERVVRFNQGVVHRMFTDARGWLWILTEQGDYLVKEERSDPEKLPGNELMAGMTSDEYVARKKLHPNEKIYFSPGWPITDPVLARKLAGDSLADFRNRYFLTFYEATDGGLWAGSSNKGLYHFSPHQKAFKTFDHVLGDKAYGRFFLETANGQILSSSTNFSSFDPNENLFYPEPELTKTKCGPMTKDSEDWIWVAAWNGLTKFNYQTKEVFEYGEAQNIPGWGIHDIWIDSRGEILVNTLQKGICRYRKATNDFEPFHVADTMTQKYLSAHLSVFFVDHAGNYWLTGLDHLIKLRPDWTFEKAFPFSLINHISEDKNHHLWLGSAESGLYHFDPMTGQHKSWTKEQGLAHNHIKSLLIDDAGNLWMGTQQGLSKFNPKTEKFQNYTSSDGLPGNVFAPRGAMKASNGELYFAVVEGGVIRFHPDSIQTNLNIPPIVLTKFMIGNRPVPIAGQQDSTWKGKSPLLCNISYTDEIKVNWNQNNFSLEFAALNFWLPEKNQYQYRLKNHDDNWISTTQDRRFVNYTNLDPGKYIFQVIGSNNDGVWNEEGVSLSIIIMPPWWWNGWSKMAYLVALLTILWYIRNYEKRRETLRYSFEMEKFKGEKLKEVSELKTQFFTNISHELRTPLTLILGPVRDLMSSSRNGDRNLLQLIENNAQRLYNLVNQLLDLSRLDARHLPLQAAENDLVAFTRHIFQFYVSTASTRNISYTFSSDKAAISVFFDRDKMEKILVNLISNAFKFTAEGESIAVVLKAEDQQVRILVSDSGIGIPEDQLSKIFDRFYQVKHAGHRNLEGSGIGLALTKELVELHHGSISASNLSAGGACFEVRLPLGKAHLKDSEIIALPDAQAEPVTMIGHVAWLQTSPPVSNYRSNDLPLVLMVEDNADMRQYLQLILSPHYRLVEAADGVQGLNFAKTHIPDLVISDIMMPGTSGLELCKQLKSEMLTCHIPVILLTAKTSQEHRIEGLEIGADAYLTKPFDHQELLVQTKSLLELRKNLRARYQSTDLNNGANPANKDDDFLVNLKQLIIQNLGDADFSILQICRKMGISRAQLYRRMKAVTDESVGNYMLKIRLHQARELLRTGQLNVSEVAYEVGFKDPAYFSRAYKKMFDHTPSKAY